MTRYLAVGDEPYEGYYPLGDEPIPTFDTREKAIGWAMVVRKMHRDDIEVWEIEV